VSADNSVKSCARICSESLPPLLKWRVQIAADPAALSQQVGEKFQCIFSAAGDNNGLPDGVGA